MNRTPLAAIAITAVVSVTISPAIANAGNGRAVGAGLLGFGVGAIVGSALTPREVYVVPPPPPPVYYAPPPPVYYAPPPPAYYAPPPRAYYVR